MIPPRSPIPNILAASPKQPTALAEDIRQRLAAAYSVSSYQDFDSFVLNARAKDSNLRQCSPALVARVARHMGDLQFGDAAPTADLRKSLSGGMNITAGEQNALANDLTTRALAEYARVRAAGRRPA